MDRIVYPFSVHGKTKNNVSLINGKKEIRHLISVLD